MADTSIPKLNRLDANTVANTDVLLIVDDPQGNPENKKVQVGELFKGSQTTRIAAEGLKVALREQDKIGTSNDVIIMEATLAGIHNMLLDSSDGSADDGDRVELEDATDGADSFVVQEGQEVRIGDPTLTTYLDGNTVTQNGYFSIGELATVSGTTAGLTGMMVANATHFQICTVGGTTGNATWMKISLASL